MHLYLSHPLASPPGHLLGHPKIIVHPPPLRLPGIIEASAKQCETILLDVTPQHIHALQCALLQLC